ncbi:MAG TPA: putative quinol monooxygenase [Gemmatales bacterium]|nr:putative quinol monooxygenase [Gemmatales bacterium]
MPDHPIIAAVKSQVKDVTLPFNMSVHASIKPGTSAPFEAAFTECIKLTRKENGCIAYDLNRSYEEPNKYINYERWASVAALDAHLNAPHTVKLLTAIAPFLDGSPVIKVYAFAGE